MPNDPTYYPLQTSRNLNLYYSITLCAAMLVSNGVYGASNQDNKSDFSIPITTKDAVGDLAQFKNFISSPPTVASLIAEVCMPTGTNQDVSSTFVLIRCQTNGFFYREAPTLLGLLSTNIFPYYSLAGCYENTYWSYSVLGESLQYSTNRNEEMVATLNFVKANASRFIHLGIDAVLPKSIVWNNNSWKPVTNHLGVVLSGDLVFTNSDLPLEMNIMAVLKNGNKVPWKLKYKFIASKTMPSFIPSVISDYVLRDRVEIFIKEIYIKDIKLSKEPLSEEYYMPDSYRKKEMVVFDDQVMKPINVQAIQTRNNTWLILVCFISLNVIFAIFFYNWKRYANNKNN